MDNDLKDNEQPPQPVWVNDPGEVLVLSLAERTAIADILKRRANDIASFRHECVRSYERMGSTTTSQEFRVTAELPGSVELALDREIDRLRRLESKVRPPKPPEPEEEE